MKTTFASFLLALLALTRADAGTYQFTNVDVPGSYLTSASGINDAGQVVGMYIDSSGDHGYVRSADGLSYTTFNDPNAIIGTTLAFGINAVGQVVGTYQDGSGSGVGFGAYRGFLMSAGGSTFTSIDDPNGIGTTNANGINAAGQIVGVYEDGSGVHGFVRSANGLSYTSFAVPNAALSSASGINDTGLIVGGYNVGLDGANGFLRMADGSTYTTIDDPTGVGTTTLGINDPGTIVGFYQASSGRTFGFIATQSAAAVPEPSSLVLFCVGSIALAGYVRCRQKEKNIKI